MPILNYTTQIAVEKSVGEIQALLMSARVAGVLTEFTDTGTLEAISFRMMGPYGMMSFRLPSRVEKVHAVMMKEKIPFSQKTRAQAARVAWRIVKDWLEAQLAMIKAEMVTLDQVFLPYMQDNQGRTLYEKLTASKFEGLALPAPKPNQEES